MGFTHWSVTMKNEIFCGLYLVYSKDKIIFRNIFEYKRVGTCFHHCVNNLLITCFSYVIAAGNGCTAMLYGHFGIQSKVLCVLGVRMVSQEKQNESKE